MNLCIKNTIKQGEKIYGANLDFNNIFELFEEYENTLTLDIFKNIL